MSAIAFRQQCEIYLSIIDEALIFEHYVKMFCGSASITKNESDEDDHSIITQSGLTALLNVCYRIAMSNYGNASSSINDNNQQTLNEPSSYNCPYVSNALICICVSMYPLYNIHIYI